MKAWSQTLRLPDSPELIALARAALADTQTEHGSSKWGEYRRCHRAHHLRYHLRIAPAPLDPVNDDEDDDRSDANYFEVGRLVHSCHRFMREGAMAGEVRDWRNVLAVAAETHDVANVYEAERLLDVYYGLRGYDNAGFPEGFKILAVERLFEAPKGSAIWPYTARADAIVELPSGEIVIVDDKTRSQAFPKDRAKFARGQATNPQFLGLSWLVWNTFEPARVPFDSVPPSLWIHGLIKTKVAKFDPIMVPFEGAALAQWAEAQASDAARGCDDDAMNYNACAPTVGSRCWAFTWCHPRGDERERHFIRKEGES